MGFPKKKRSNGSSIKFTYAFEERKLNKSELLPNVILPKPVLLRFGEEIGRSRLSRRFSIAGLGSSPYQYSYKNYQNKNHLVFQPMERRKRIPPCVKSASIVAKEKVDTYKSTKKTMAKKDTKKSTKKKVAKEDTKKSTKK